MRIRFLFPEPGLSRAARACLVLDGLLLGILMLWLSWSPDAYEQFSPRVNPPLANVPDVDDGWHASDDDRLILSMTADGRVWHQEEALEDLGGWLDREVRAYDDKRRAIGKRGFEDFPGDRQGSRLYALLRIDREAPWGAAHGMLRRLGQSSIYKIILIAVNDRHARSYLPIYMPTADHDRAYVTARVGRDGSISIDGRDIAAPTEAIRSAYRALANADQPAAGLVDAAPDIPYGDVVRAIDALACAGVEPIELAAGSVRAVVVPRPR